MPHCRRSDGPERTSVTHTPSVAVSQRYGALRYSMRIMETAVAGKTGTPRRIAMENGRNETEERKTRVWAPPLGLQLYRFQPNWFAEISIEV